MNLLNKINKKYYVVFFFCLISIILVLVLLLNFNTNDLKANVLLENDNIKLFINDTTYYDGIANLEYDKTKRLKLDINFKDNTSSNKKIEIDIENGLTYKLYPVIEQEDEDIQTIITEDNILYKAINKVTYPNIEQSQIIDTNPYYVVKYKSSYGKIIYDVNPNIEKLTLFIDIAPDYHKLYNPEYNNDNKTYNNKLIEDGINVSIHKDNRVISNISLDTKIVVDEHMVLELKKTSSGLYTSSNFASRNEQDTVYGYTKSDVFAITDINKYYFYGLPNYKKAKITMYYPKNTEFVDLVYTNNTVATGCIKVEKGNEESSDCTIVNYSNDNKIVVSLNKFNGNFVNRFSLKYKVNTINQIGIKKDDIIRWTAPSPNNIEFTFYDETKRTYYSDETNTLDLYHPDSFVNKMDIVNPQNIFDDHDDSTFIYGPSFVIENNSPGRKYNQVLEYEIDPNYQVIAVTFPKPEGAMIRNIQYKTNINNEWQTVYPTNIDLNSTRYLFTLEDANISFDKEIYFTAVKGVVDYYYEGYKSSTSAARDVTNAIAYGNLKSKAENANVTFKMYAEPELGKEIDSNTLISETRLVTFSQNKTIGVNPGTVNFTNNDSKIISNIFTNEDFHLIGYLRPHKYPYGSRIYMDNTEIYIKQPNGFVIDIQNMSIRDEKNNPIKYTLEKKTNKFGELVYILKTNKRTGVDVSKRGILNLVANEIKVNIKYHIEENCEYKSINIKDLIGIGNPEYAYVSRGTTDDTDLNANNNVTEQVFYVSNKALTIMPTKKFSISAFIVKDDKQYTSYNETNEDTIIKLRPKDNFEYKINVSNHSESIIENYEILIPIPKKGVDFGEKFQKEMFYWDVDLLELIGSTEDYDVFYSTERNKSNLEKGNYNFKKDIDDIKDITMIKVVSTKPIDANEVYNINLKLRVNDVESYINTNKINISNILYEINSSTLKGEFKTNYNALKLYSPSIAGILYEDINVDGKYSMDDKKIIDGIKLELWKKVDDNYNKVSDINIIDGTFIINDINILSSDIYALKIINGDYKIFSDIVVDNYIKNINVIGGEQKHFEIGFIKYKLGFDVNNSIIKKGELLEVSLENITPSYFDKIKNTNLSYEWLIESKYNDYVKVNNENTSSIIIEGLKETLEDVKVCAKIYDMYNESFNKCFNVKVKENGIPIIYADDVHLVIGEKIDYKEYIKKAIDYRESVINLNFKSNVKIISNIPHLNNYATTKGVYEVTYEVTDVYGNVGKKTIKVYVDGIGAVIENPSTYDEVIKEYLILNLSVLILTILITYILSKKKNKIK